MLQEELQNIPRSASDSFLTVLDTGNDEKNLIKESDDRY